MRRSDPNVPHGDSRFGGLATPGEWADAPHVTRLSRATVVALLAAVALAVSLLTPDRLRLGDLLIAVGVAVVATSAVLAVRLRRVLSSTRRAEVAYRSALDEREAFFEVSIELLATATTDGRFIRLNRAWEQTFGYKTEEMCSRPYADFVHPDDRAATAAAKTTLANGRVVMNFANRYRRKDGEYRWLEWTATPSADGALVHAVARDITERKLAEERQMAPTLERQRRVDEGRRLIGNLIATTAFAPVFQPVLPLAGGRPLGFEALTRFTGGRAPDKTFALARECGLAIDLERVTLAAALAAARSLPDHAWLSINLSPSAVSDPIIRRELLEQTARQIVLEVTEHEAIGDYEALREAARELGPSVRIAVDDVGAGVANFNHLVEIRPHFVKIDRSLVRGVDSDIGRQAVVVGLLHFATTADAEVIAEGIETEGERAALADLGVRFGQGYLLGKPTTAPPWAGAAKRKRGATPAADRSAVNRPRATWGAAVGT